MHPAGADGCVMMCCVIQARNTRGALVLRTDWESGTGGRGAGGTAPPPRPKIDFKVRLSSAYGQVRAEG